MQKDARKDFGLIKTNVIIKFQGEWCSEFSTAGEYYSSFITDEEWLDVFYKRYLQRSPCLAKINQLYWSIIKTGVSKAQICVKVCT